MLDATGDGDATIVRDRNGSHLVTSAADVFAFGLLACEMLTGDHAFGDELPVHAALDGRGCPMARPIRGTAGVSDRVAVSLETCLMEDPLRRPSIQEIMSVLETSG
jgi:Protein tyrosine and serine/threonine kinase